MKKFYFLIVVWILIILPGCSLDNKDIDNIIGQENTDIKNNITYESYNLEAKFPMEKPSIEMMSNFDAIINGYVKNWEMDYVLTKHDIQYLEYLDRDCSEIIVQGGNQHTRYSNSFNPSSIKAGKKITLNGTYKFDDSKLQLTDDEKLILSQKGWNIVPAERYENYYKLDYSEDRAEDETQGNLEEWTKLYSKIGGYNLVYERYPANTILITNDLLLHSFHKLFDNTLKYYEETTARNTIKELSQNLFMKFINLAKNETDGELKDTYGFLAAYWSIPAIILVDAEQFEIKDDKSRYYYTKEKTNNDFTIQNIIQSNMDNYLHYFDDVSPKYEKLISYAIEHILEASLSREIDVFLARYSPNFIMKHKIMQDYTQFKPRSHYTDSAELKTYFMAMKWLMREKFYFGDDKLVNTALLMVNNISDEDVQKLSELSDKIKKLIGGDDDLTLESLSNWMKENNLNSIESIKNITQEQKNELYKLVPQKIQSNSLSSESTMEISSEDAKDMTAGFVFFGEKFTFDSYLFDLVTASKAEKEYQYMPNKQTALIVPEILAGNSDAAELVNLWMKERMEKKDILEDSEFTQYSSYDKVKQEATEKITQELNNITGTSTVYHTWLDMLGYLFNEPGENAPYFKFDPLYKIKKLVTYMGSYTELKHDTLLYVKQPHAGTISSAAGPGKNCSIRIDPPALPVPRGYIEADMDIIDRLIELNEETKLDFQGLGTQVDSKFEEFDKFLNHTKNILNQQMNNEIISDEDFEWMRTVYNDLGFITYPSGKNVTQKEMRAALIADIFTSEHNGSVDPLYEAVGRPAIMMLMVDDINGSRVAIGPVFTHYEFYDSDGVISNNGSRLDDIQRQANYDNLTGQSLESANSILSKKLYDGLLIQN